MAYARSFQALPYVDSVCADSLMNGKNGKHIQGAREINNSIISNHWFVIID